MTVLKAPTVRPSFVPRLDAERWVDQLAGIDALTQRRREVERAASSAGSREQRLDHARRLDVVRRQHETLLAATERQLRDTGDVLSSAPVPSVVIAHRNGWFTQKVATGVRAAGVTVAAELTNGADAVGLVVAEQPDLLLLEDRLPMLGGADVLADVRRMAPRTLVAVQVGDDDDLGVFLEGGASAAFTRRVPPADVAAVLQDLLTA